MKFDEENIGIIVGERFLMPVAEYIFEESQNNIESSNLFDTGDMWRTAKPPFFDGQMIRFGYTDPAAPAHEFGTGPMGEQGRPGYKISKAGRFDIAEWVRLKSSMGDMVLYIDRADGTRKQKYLTKAEKKKATYRIIQKIEKDGFMARPFLRPAIKSAKAYFERK